MDVDKQDLFDVRNELIRQMTAGFAQITGRLDLQNSRLSKAEALLAQERTRIDEVKAQNDQQWTAITDSKDRRMIVQPAWHRDIGVAGGGAGLGVVLIEVLRALLAASGG